MQNLVEKNPVAFSEDIAAQCEVAYRSASEKAWKELNRVAKQPYYKQNQRMFTTSLDDLRIERPFFVAPTLSKKASHPPFYLSMRFWTLQSYLPVEEETTRKKNVRSWNVDASLFAQRKKENDSRGLYDTDKTLSKQFEIDWDRVASKSRFHRLVGREDAGYDNPLAHSTTASHQ